MILFHHKAKGEIQKVRDSRDLTPPPPLFALVRFRSHNNMGQGFYKKNLSKNAALHTRAYVEVETFRTCAKRKQAKAYQSKDIHMKRTNG